jgi:hypothetical protein
MNTRYTIVGKMNHNGFNMRHKNVCRCKKINNIGCHKFHEICRDKNCNKGKSCPYKHSVNKKHIGIFSGLNINDILHMIFDYLYLRELGRYATVCKEWNKIIMNPMFWKSKYPHFIDNIEWLYKTYDRRLIKYTDRSVLLSYSKIKWTGIIDTKKTITEVNTIFGTVKKLEIRFINNAKIVIRSDEKYAYLIDTINNYTLEELYLLIGGYSSDYDRVLLNVFNDVERSKNNLNTFNNSQDPFEFIKNNTKSVCKDIFQDYINTRELCKMNAEDDYYNSLDDYKESECCCRSGCAMCA